MQKLWRQRGFTLIELLVVISIISILIAMGTVSFTTAQRNGRDSKRQADMKSTQNAFEQYFSQNSAYPTNCNAGSSEITSVMPNGRPSGPRPSEEYTWACPISGTTAGTSYCVCASLEKVGTGNSAAANCSDLTASGDFYCVSNLQ